ncbi:JNK-interacting protein 3-like [Homarus americanus]|uniref:JNK-interacting protein 3-like n=1 Tax=Homarus americanus TaxID=6706 RepID=A0A8J5N6E7_HOMAM|nr:JNK-interacting protein 3-like [Homarus americanus]
MAGVRVLAWQVYELLQVWQVLDKVQLALGRSWLALAHWYTVLTPDRGGQLLCECVDSWSSLLFLHHHHLALSSPPLSPPPPAPVHPAPLGSHGFPSLPSCTSLWPHPPTDTTTTPLQPSHHPQPSSTMPPAPSSTHSSSLLPPFPTLTTTTARRGWRGTQQEWKQRGNKSSKLLELEDGMEEEKKQCQSRVETLESIVRMFELKNRNATDHANRMEDKSEEMKKEYTKLHDRYTELFKTHMDYMERTKILMGTDRLDQLGGSRGRIPGFTLGNLNSIPFRSTGPLSFGFSSLDPNKSISSPVDMSGSANGTVQVTSLRNELQEAQVGPDTPVVHTDKGQLTDTIEQADRETATSMGKEVENLIMENNELLATKNALNIVKDDLIAKVDELTRIYWKLIDMTLFPKRIPIELSKRSYVVKSLNAVKSRLKLRITELEDEVKIKEEAEKNAKANKSDDEEAVRWTEMIRATRNDPSVDKKNKQTMEILFLKSHINDQHIYYGFSFSNLFSTSERPQRKPLPYGNVRYNAPAHQVTPALNVAQNLSDHERKGLEIFDTGFFVFYLLFTLKEFLREVATAPVLKPETSKQARTVKKNSRMQAYGWSLPAKTGQKAIEGPQAQPKSSSSTHVPVPVPVYCRPLMEKEPGMKIWCAAGVNLTGGRTKDGGNIVGASVFYSGDTETTIIKPEDEIDKLDMELQEHEKDRKEGELLEQTLSSLVWICTSTHSISKVTVIDANNPADILESFHVCSSHLLCIASVPGAKESDYSIDEDLNKLVEESQQSNNCDNPGDASANDNKIKRRADRPWAPFHL